MSKLAIPSMYITIDFKEFFQLVWDSSSTINVAILFNIKLRVFPIEENHPNHHARKMREVANLKGYRLGLRTFIFG